MIRVGTEGTYAPNTYHDENGDLVGFDVEVAAVIAEKLGVDVEYVETEWSSIFSSLDAGNIDIVVNEVGYNEERAAKYDFRIPYSFVQKAILIKGDNEDMADGYTITKEKLTLLHNVPCFEALEVESYRIDRELQKFVTERAAFIYEYAISLGNECLVCSTYFKNKLAEFGVSNMDDFELTEDERLLLDLAGAITTDVRHIPEDIYARLTARFNEEQIVVIVTMGVFMVANNYFNDILKVDPSPYK